MQIKTKIKLLVCFVFFFLLVGIYSTSFVFNINPWFHNEEMVSKDNIVTGDGFNNSEAYHYWYAPEHSFGISSFRMINWSYFKQLFLKHIDWRLEYKRYSWSDWTDGNDYLTIERTWNDTGFWKFNLILDVPINIYTARFIFAIDKPMLQYVERDGTEVWINYTANNTETYSCYFNWSDMANIPGIIFNKGVQNNKFWFMFQKYDIPSGTYEFDPSFGHTNAETTTVSISDTYIGDKRSPASSGTADSICLYVHSSWYPGLEKISCALYNSGDDTLVAGTEERDDGGDGWFTFEFNDPKPAISSEINYYIVAVGSGTIYMAYKSSGSGYYISEDGVYEDRWKDPIDPSAWSGYDVAIYCNYTEGGSPPENNDPVISGEVPSNESTDIQRDIPCKNLNVTVTDSDSDTMNVTWLSNSSGSWVQFGSNLSVSSGTSIIQCNSNFTTYGTTYYWSVNVSDGNGSWVNETFHFTLEVNNNPAISGEVPVNNSVDIGLSPTCNITVTDADGDTMDVTFAENSTGDWVNIQSNMTVGNGSYSFVFTNADSYSTNYWWKVYVNDSIVNISDTFHFTTVDEANNPPVLSNENPVNNSVDMSLSFIWNVTIQDPDADTFNWNINCSGVNESSADDDTNGSKTVNLDSMDYATTYKVWVNVTDGTDEVKEWFSFTTKTNSPPVLSNEVPSNESTDIEITTNQVSIDINDPEGDTMDWSIEVNNSDTDNDNGVGNGTITCSLSTPLSYDTTYTWWVNVTDGTNVVNETYVFTTGTAPITSEDYVYFSSYSVTNNSKNNKINVYSYSVYINNSGNNKMWYNITMYDSYNIKTLTNSGNCLNSTIYLNVTNSLWLGYNYTIWFNVTNSTGVNFNKSIEFRTIETINSGGGSNSRHVIGVIGIIGIIGIIGYIFKRRR